MAIWNEVADPQELTVVARAAAEARENEAEFSLSRFLPNVYKQDKYLTLEVGENGLQDVAEYRAYDAETPLGGRGEVGRRISLELPPLGQKRRVSEYDQLNRLGSGGEAAIRDAVGRATVARARSVADRIELERGRVIASGRAVISENGFFGESDFGRDADLAVTAGTQWSDAAATPVDDLINWFETYSEKNGQEPGYIVVSTKIASALARYKGFLPEKSLRSRASFDEINAVLAAEGLPSLIKYDRKVKVDGTVTRVLPQEQVIMLPSEVSEMGGTFWGTTLESLDSRYNIQPEDRPGIVAGAYKDDDPMGVWVKASAIALPALANANLAMTATVL